MTAVVGEAEYAVVVLNRGYRLPVDKVCRALNNVNAIGCAIDDDPALARSTDLESAEVRRCQQDNASRDRIVCLGRIDGDAGSYTRVIDIAVQQLIQAGILGS